MQTIQTSVSELMTAPVVTIGPDALAGEVLALAHAEGIHHFPIVREGRLIGIVCTCDLQDLRPDARVQQMAWRHVVTLPPECDVVDAARLMTSHGVGSIVISDADRICGIVTREDLVRADPNLEQLLAEARCAACGARKHLRPWLDGQCLCQGCHGRAKDGADLDVGGSG
jgi:predicted transcriptional regulator